MSSTSPKISIILPTYNRERFLPAAINAILAQSETDWELIVVNDHSPDNTITVVEEYIKKDSRIRLITNDVNKKLPASLNEGFRHARGKYFTWTSDDNLYHPNALQMMSGYLDAHKGTDMVVMNSAMLDENDEPVFDTYDFAHRYNHERNAAYLASVNNVNAAFMYTREIANEVGEYDVDTFCAEDYDYWIRIALKGNIAYTDDIVYTYRLHSASLTETEKGIIAPLTQKLIDKYADNLLNKYYTKWIDKYKFAYTNRNTRLKNHTLTALCGKCSYRLLKLATSFIFWSSKKRKAIRQAIKNWHETYSFTILRQK